MFLAFPSFSGDFRLSPDKEAPTERCVLTVKDPTPGEVETLKRFEKAAVKKGWTDLARLHERESTVLVAPYQEAGGVLLKILGLDSRGSILAIAFENGKPKVEELIDPESLPAWLQKAEGGKVKPTAAAVVRQPQVGCPNPAPEPARPEQVLLPFLSEQQRKQWDRDRAFLVRGSDSGTRYLVAARYTELARKASRIVFDIDHNQPVCLYDSLLPPEEEVLGAKLFIEHREHRVVPSASRRVCNILRWA